MTYWRPESERSPVFIFLGRKVLPHFFMIVSDFYFCFCYNKIVLL